MWPEGLSLAEQRRLAKDPSLGDPLAAGVQRKGSGFEAVPLHRDPLFGPPGARAGRAARGGGGRRRAPALCLAYLRGRARAFTGGPKGPALEGDGRFEVLVGPYAAPGAPARGSRGSEC